LDGHELSGLTRLHSAACSGTTERSSRGLDIGSHIVINNADVARDAIDPCQAVSLVHWVQTAAAVASPEEASGAVVN
jgi:hypothetical protein